MPEFSASFAQNRAEDQATITGAVSSGEPPVGVGYRPGVSRAEVAIVGGGVVGLSCARELWRTLPETETESERVELGRMTFRLVHLADILAVTTSE